MKQRIKYCIIFLFFSTVVMVGVIYFNQPLSKGKMLVFGDSIVWQDGNAYMEGPESGEIAHGWQYYVCEQCGFEGYDNQGIIGSTITDELYEPSIYDIIMETDIKDYKLIIISVGTNDFKLGAILGSQDTCNDKNTFYGAMCLALDSIKERNKKCKIVLFTPLQRNKAGYDIYTCNTAGYMLSDYVEAIKEIGGLYDIPVCDMYYYSGITMDNLDIYTRDGLHPNQKGYEIIGRVAVDFINALY